MQESGIAEARARNAGVSSWLDRYSQQKWHWAGHVVRMAETRLARRTTLWRDSEWWSVERFMPHRPVHAQGGAQHVRWEDDLHNCASHQGWIPWRVKASYDSKDQWNTYAEGFSRWVSRSFHCIY